MQFSLFEGRFGRMRLERTGIRHDIRHGLYISQLGVILEGLDLIL